MRPAMEIVILVGILVSTAAIILLGPRIISLADRSPEYVAKNTALTIDTIAAAPEGAEVVYKIPEDKWKINNPLKVDYQLSRVIASVAFYENYVFVGRDDVCQIGAFFVDKIFNSPKEFILTGKIDFEDVENIIEQNSQSARFYKANYNYEFRGGNCAGDLTNCNTYVGILDENVGKIKEGVAEAIYLGKSTGKKFLEGIGNIVDKMGSLFGFDLGASESVEDVEDALEEVELSVKEVLDMTGLTVFFGEWESYNDPAAFEFTKENDKIIVDVKCN